MPEQLSLDRIPAPAPRVRYIFVARPDPAATEQLTRLANTLRTEGHLPGRPVDPDRFHITFFHLEFVDQVPRRLVEEASAAAAALAWKAFDVAFDRVGGTKRMLLLRASDDAAIVAFRKDLGAALIKGGLRRYVDAAFNPHVTLSYDPSDAPERIVAPVSWTVREFLLIESLIGQHRHIVRGRWSCSP